MEKAKAIELLRNAVPAKALPDDEIGFFIEAVCMAIKALEGKDTNVPTKWIPVSEKEKLPENGRKVLVKADDVYYSLGQQNGVVIGWRNGDYWSTYTVNGKAYIRYPSKWMPLPEPYKEG